jgi:hypothetical protein
VLGLAGFKTPVGSPPRGAARCRASLEVGDLVVTVRCLMDDVDQSGRSPIAGAIRFVGAESDGSVAVLFL